VSVAGDRSVASEVGASDLDRFATAAITAAAELPPPRRPWLDPLPADLALEDLLVAGPPVPFAGEHGVTVPMALLDDPPAQAQYPAGWNLEAGNLLLFGIGGSGTTTAMQTLALSLAAAATPDALHIYVLDFGAGELQPLQELPHVGAVINANERERQVRLLRWLRRELAARRSGASAGDSRIVLLLDGYAGFAAEQSDATGDSVRDDLGRVWADGTEVGIHVVIGADRIGAVPVGLSSLAQQRLVLRLAELSDYAQFGLSRRSIPRFTPGRAVLAATSPRVLQIARSRLRVVDAVARLAARHDAPARRPPATIGTLPERITVRELLDRSGPPDAGDRARWLPVGIDDETLRVAGWSLYVGEHALIAGPPRSGRTNTLVALAQACAALHPKLPIHAVALRRSRLIQLPGLSGRATTAEQLTELVSTLKAAAGAALLLVDDADAVDDSSRALSELVGDPEGAVHVIAAGRADGLRALGHWTAGARASRNGLLLQPDLNLDGGLFGVALPRRPAPPARPGCGYLIRAGAFGLTQAALADSR
jgi:S-DNA-T family DNA segregation ATPase FtsK/SpoIIIE